MYLFDFGDEWWHDITVEQTDAPAEKGKYPRIVEEHGKAPPQYPDLDEEEGYEDEENDEDGDDDKEGGDEDEETEDEDEEDEEE